MSKWVVLRQNESVDLWDPVYVDVEAETCIDAIEIAVKTSNREGRYVAVPASYWVAQDVTVAVIAEVDMSQRELI